MRQTLYIPSPDEVMPGVRMETEVDCEVVDGKITEVYGVGEISLCRTDAPVGSCPSHLPWRDAAKVEQPDPESDQGANICAALKQFRSRE
jgi:hypothetical protein